MSLLQSDSSLLSRDYLKTEVIDPQILKVESTSKQITDIKFWRTKSDKFFVAIWFTQDTGLEEVSLNFIPDPTRETANFRLEPGSREIKLTTIPKLES